MTKIGYCDYQWVRIDHAFDQRIEVPRLMDKLDNIRKKMKLGIFKEGAIDLVNECTRIRFRLYILTGKHL